MTGIIENIWAYIWATPISTILIVAFMIILIVFFILIFCLRAWSLRGSLIRIVSSLNGTKNASKQNLKKTFGENETLAHLWNEYADTLHRQQEHGAGGKQPVDTLWSTVPASSIFTTDAIVDTRLWTELFKHLPGIFTGLGIIGTFSGLITGLQTFQATAPDLNVVRVGLEGLMHRVGDAFVVSAFAIGLAMFMTLIERYCVTYLYKQVENITTKIDGLFNSGVGEEYLSRLTRASEESAGQSKILKDALVGDLERILTKLTETQISAQGVTMQRLGEHIAKGVADTLSGPLDAFAKTAQENKEGNAQAVTQMLTDVLSSFSQKLEELLGGQIVGINNMQQKTIEALGVAILKITEMTTTIQSAGDRSAETINEQLRNSLREMNEHQTSANDGMATFIDHIKGALEQSQSETSRKIQEALGQIGVAAQSQIEALRVQTERSATAQSERDDAITARTNDILRAFGTRVEAILNSLQTNIEGSAEAQADRDKRAAENADDRIVQLSAAVDDQLKNIRNQNDTSTAAQTERDAAIAERTEGLALQLGVKVDEVLGSMQGRIDRSEEAQYERDRQSAVSIESNIAKLSASVEEQLANLRQQGNNSAISNQEREIANAARTQDTILLLASKVDGMVGAMQAQIEKSAASHYEREERISAQTVETIEKLSKIAGNLMTEVRAVTTEIQAVASAMGAATTSAIDKMNSGSETIHLASLEFATAGQSVAAVLEKADGLSTTLIQSGLSVSEASATLTGVVEDHASARDALAKMMEQMGVIVENAKKEAGFSKDAIDRIESASLGLGKAQKQAEEYLGEVTRILATTHEKYATSMSSVLNTQYNEFYNRLTKATSLLRSAIEDLATSVTEAHRLATSVTEAHP